MSEFVRAALTLWFVASFSLFVLSVLVMARCLERFVRAVEDLGAILRVKGVSDGSRRPEQRDFGQVTPIPRAATHTSAAVPNLAPDVVAPSLRRPPRPAGGFGSRVGAGDGVQRQTRDAGDAAEPKDADPGAAGTAGID